MRVRKIHAVLAVSVALVLVARSIQGRRGQHGFPVEPDGEVPSEGHVGSLTAEPVSLTECEAESSAVAAATADAGTVGDPEPPVDAEVSAEDGPSALEQPATDPESLAEAEHVALEEPVALEAELRSEEPVPALPEVESDAGSSGKRRLPRGPLAVAAAVIVLIAVLAGTALAVAAGATSSPSAPHHRAPSSLHP
jgi:hypothetical protein